MKKEEKEKVRRNWAIISAVVLQCRFAIQRNGSQGDSTLWYVSCPFISHMHLGFDPSFLGLCGAKLLNYSLAALYSLQICVTYGPVITQTCIPYSAVSLTAPVIAQTRVPYDTIHRI
jgi:hypothetical protein